VKTSIWSLLLALMWSLSQAPQPPSRPKPESLRARVLRVLGISASPSTLRAPAEAFETGEVWVIDLQRGTRERITAEAAYRSPIFEAETGAVLALRDETVVRITRTGKPADLWSVKGLVKLVGSNRDVARQALVLVRDVQGTMSPAFLSLDDGSVELVPYDRTSTEDRRLLEHLSAWDRVYDDVRLSVRRETKAGSAGTRQWMEVYLKRGTAPAANISQCDGIDCGQPSLSPDGRLVVYVRAPGPSF
jgi:hypothetical protein